MASPYSWAGWSESNFVKNPEDRFFSIEAHITKWITLYNQTTDNSSEKSGPEDF